MNADDNDKLWKLLGKTRQPAVSPFFARNVLRAVRQEEQEGRPGRSFLSRMNRSMHRWSWQLAIGATCALAALITVSPGGLVRHHHRAPAEATFARQIVGNPDYEVIKHLDELVADEESSLWLDDTVN
jgi:hypothetical protein